MEIDQIIVELEQEWDIESGFLGKLRMGKFDSDASDRLLEKLRSISLGDGQMIDRRLVALTWYIPIFMTWQRERVQKDNLASIASYDLIQNHITEVLEKILGVP